MKKRMLFCLTLTFASVSLLAQKSDKAEKYANRLFNNVFDSYITRMGNIKDSIDVKLVIRLDSLVNGVSSNGKNDVTKALIATLDFSPLWDKDNKLIRKLFITYQKHLENIPTTHLEEWHIMTDIDAVKSALSLAAENTLFPNEKFSESAFQTFIKKFK